MTLHTPRDFRPVMHQTWRELLFAHWPVPVAHMNALLPHPLAAHEYDGEAWVAVVPFLMTGVRARGLPPVPLTHRLLELNVRTYVSLDDEPGVYFFSLDADNPLAVEVARRAFHLNYLNAGMSLTHHGDEIHYASHRTDGRALPAKFAARYRAHGEPFETKPGTLENWLTERYALYAADGTGAVWRGRIHHRPWRLQRAEAVFPVDEVAASHGLELPDIPPLLHYAHQTNMTAGLPQQIR